MGWRWVRGQEPEAAAEAGEPAVAGADLLVRGRLGPGARGGGSPPPAAEAGKQLMST